MSIHRLPATRLTRIPLCSLTTLALAWALMASSAQAQLPAPSDNQLPNTQPLTLEQPLDEVMVAGIDHFALRELAAAPARRTAFWASNFPERSEAPNLVSLRHALKVLIGAVDPRVTPTGIQLIRTAGADEPLVDHREFTVDAVRWPVLDGVTGEGLLLSPKGPVTARMIFLPDADITPEELVGLDGNAPLPNTHVLDLASQGVQVLIPALINRESTWSVRRYPQTLATNLPHREYVYRMAFELGRHVIGYEVQKVLAAVDNLELSADPGSADINVIGIGEGGLVALFSAALDPRIDSTQIIDYFEAREGVWEQPIYRNVWGQLTMFGDAELAVMAAIPPTRRVVISHMGLAAQVEGPPAAGSDVRAIAAPGTIRTPSDAAISAEFERAEKLFKALTGLPKPDQNSRIQRIDDARAILRGSLGDKTVPAADPLPKPSRALSDPEVRQRRQVNELVDHVQSLLRGCARVRDELWNRGSSSWPDFAEAQRHMVYDELIGRLSPANVPANPRTRRILDEAEYTGYEVVLDVQPDIIAGGILLLPKDLKAGERRPVVVCQHGLEGTPMHTITTDPNEGFNAYKAFSVQLAKRGFIVYAPQNPYRGHDRFRTLQRKSNPLKRSLFSYIIPQHERTLEWLSSLSYVDPERIGFYGLSYGGKTAVRVPPLVPQYALSICSADFNEWVVKNASIDNRYSYVYTGEYEIFEWNMGHVANYAELASLMAPRPFMVERGHDDGVAPDEWVAWEYAKVRRHYVKLGHGDRTEIEFFDGPHTINGQGTFEFLHKHLEWDDEE